MPLRLHAFACFLALTAMVLRAALPSGWMSVAETSGGTTLVICTGHGPMTMPGHSHHQKAPASHENEVCPFAAVGHLSPPLPFALLVVPVWYGDKSNPPAIGRTAPLAQPQYSDHAPRAPPHVV